MTKVTPTIGTRPADLRRNVHARTPIVLVHGSLTSRAVWKDVLPALASRLPGHEVTAPERPRTGTIQGEVEWLAGLAREGWVVGLNGGATIALALAATDTPLAGAILHEPPPGQLSPAAFDAVSVYGRGGPGAVGELLFGRSWTLEQSAPAPEEVVRAELELFSRHRVQRLSRTSGRVVVTCGSESAAARHANAAALHEFLGCEQREVPGVAEHATRDAPEAFAAVVRAIVLAST